MRNILRQMAGLVIGAVVTVAVMAVANVFAQDEPGAGSVPVAVNLINADAALTIHYQGQLFDPTTNTPRANAAFNSSFRFFSQSAGGTNLWVEDKVIVTNVDGIFNTRLGDVNPFPSPTSLFNGQELWLEIVLNGEVTTPRQPINYVPYAMWARNSSFSTRSANSDTVGGVPARDLPRIVAFGVVNDDGGRASGRDFSSSYTLVGGELAYVIDIPSINHSINNYTTIVTPACIRPVHFGVGSSSGDLVVDMWDSNGARTQCRFEFMVLAR
jgi:hypothetical protein